MVTKLNFCYSFSSGSYFQDISAIVAVVFEIEMISIHQSVLGFLKLHSSRKLVCVCTPPGTICTSYSRLNNINNFSVTASYS